MRDVASAEAHQKFSASRPRVGDLATFEDAHYRITSIEGNLCWIEYPDGQRAPFIWCFKDGLNALASWPSKRSDHPRTFCPGVGIV